MRLHFHLLLLAFIWLAGPPCSIGAAENQRRDILFIVADDLRADMIHALGHPMARTPHLDALADRGTVFTRAVCGYPICHVSRTEMLSGRCLVREATKPGPVPISPEWKLLPQVLRDAGWVTVHSGKWHVHGAPKQRGYSEIAGLYSSGGGQALTLPQSATKHPVTGYRGWTFKDPSNKPMPELGVGLMPDTDVRLTDEVIRCIQLHEKAPLFLHVNFTATHDPLHWPSGKEESYRSSEMPLPENVRPAHPFDHGNLQGRDELIVPAPRSPDSVKAEHAVYLAQLEQMDAQIGRILKALQDAGRLENTLVIFTSDQGMALGSHGLMGKQNQYEHTANAPLILAGPGIPSGKRVATQCYLRDIYPTICDLMGVEIPPTVQGRSLAPILRGDVTEIHEAIYGYFTDSQRMVRTADGWKLVVYPKAGRTQMFQVEKDPGEMQDLSTDSQHAAQKSRLTNLLRTWQESQSDPVLVK